MSIVSIEYLLIVFAGVVIYYTLNINYRKYYLLIVSLGFYFFIDQNYLGLVLLVSLKDYLVIRNTTNKSNQINNRRIIKFSIILDILILIFFKYYLYSYGISTKILLQLGFDTTNIPAQILLPIGLSYYIFKSISLNIEAYRENVKFNNDFANILLYLSFFPTIMSGPIDRPQSLINEFDNLKKFDYNSIRSGLILIGWGYFQKLVIVNRISPYIDNVYSNPEQFNGISVLMAIFLYSVLIYSDFAGYSCIAIGTGCLFGIKISENFRKPYFSVSITEFWRRWHITLTNWLRDYVFLPISYKVNRYLNNFNLSKKTNELITYSIAVTITMALAGIWHGAGFSFLIWGLFLAFGMIFSRLRVYFFKNMDRKLKNKIPNILKILFVFLFISISWVFFRAASLSDIVAVFNSSTNFYKFFYGLTSFGTGKGVFFDLFLIWEGKIFFINIAIIIIFLIIEYIQKEFTISDYIIRRNLFTRWVFYFLLTYSTLFLGNYGQNYFLYFRF